MSKWPKWVCNFVKFVEQLLCVSKSQSKLGCTVFVDTTLPPTILEFKAVQKLAICQLVRYPNIYYAFFDGRRSQFFFVAVRGDIEFSRTVTGVGPDGTFDLELDTDPPTGQRSSRFQRHNTEITKLDF